MITPTKLPKLVIATDNYLPRHDGVARFLQEIIPRLTKHFAVTLICPGYARIPPVAHVEIITVPLSKTSVGDFRISTWSPRIISRALKDASIVFTQTIGPIGATTLFLAKRKKIITTAYIHSLDWELIFQASAPTIFKKYVPFLARKYARYLYGNLSRLFIPSDGISEQFTWEKIYTPRTIVQLGVDTEQFKPVTAAYREAIRTKLGFTTEDIIIGYHGRIAREKDISTLLRAFVKLRKKHKHLKLLLIGNGLSTLEKQFSSQPGVTLYPAVDDVENYLPAMDLYCLTSLTETTSLSVLEAMSYGIAVVATPVGFVKDYIVPGETGLLTKKKDSYHVAKQLNILLTQPKLREKIGKNSREMVCQRFNWDVTADILITELEKLGTRK